MNKKRLCCTKVSSTSSILALKISIRNPFIWTHLPTGEKYATRQLYLILELLKRFFTKQMQIHKLYIKWLKLQSKFEDFETIFHHIYFISFPLIFTRAIEFLLRNLNYSEICFLESRKNGGRFIVQLHSLHNLTRGFVMNFYILKDCYILDC